MKNLIAIRNNLFALLVMALLAVSAVADESDTSFIRLGIDPYNGSPGEQAVLIGDARIYLLDQLYVEAYKTNQKNSHAYLALDLSRLSVVDMEIRAGMEDDYLKAGAYLSIDFGDASMPAMRATIGGECLEREVALLKEKNNNPNDTYKESYACGPAGALEINGYGSINIADSNIYTMGYIRGDIGVGSWGASAGMNFQVTENTVIGVSYIYEEPDRGETDDRKEGEAFDAPRVKSDTLNLKGEKRAGFNFAYMF